MEILLARGGVEGVARRLAHDPQSWLTTYQGVPQDRQFTRLYKLLSTVEGSTVRPLIYREVAPSERLGEAWLWAQLERESGGWRLRDDLRGTFRYQGPAHKADGTRSW
jgi:hypothetical protein